MNYTFQQVILDLRNDTIGVVVAFHTGTNISKIKTYYFESSEENDVDDILDKCKIIIENE